MQTSFLQATTPGKLGRNAFQAAIATHGAAVGLTPGQITTAQARCGGIIGRLDDKTAKKNAWQASINAANTGNPTDFAALRDTIAAIKANSGYTESIGADLESSARPIPSIRTRTRPS